MGGILNSTALLALSANRPLIRIFSSQYSAQNVSQLQVVNEYSINWTVAGPQTLPGFSAVCYLTAATVYDEFNGTLPMGLIDTSVGGTAIQLWIPPLSFNDCAAYMQSYDVYRWPWSASCWWNGMTSPFTIGPTSAAAFLWDQGENNVGEDAFYECAFPLLINLWRNAFQNPTAPFLFVQLPGYVRQNDTQLGSFRQAQLAALALPNVGFVCTADDSDAYDGSIHNRDKAVVGARMGAVALNMIYGMTQTPYLSPMYESAAAVTQGTTVTVTVQVNKEGIYDGLEWVDPSFDSNTTWCPCAPPRGVCNQSCGWFGIQTSDGKWLNATATITSDKQSIILTAEAAAPGLTVVSTSNGYADWPVVNVFNSAGLPLVPWPPRNVTSAVVTFGGQ